MGTYAYVTMSGSAGKTTSDVTMAIQLARQGKRVRLTDTDAQANATTWLGYPEFSGRSIADVLRGQATIEEVELPARALRGYDEDDNPVYDPIPNLTIVPAVRDTLDKVQVELNAILGGVLRLREALEAAPTVDEDLIDCAGSLNSIVIAAMLATTKDEDLKPGGWGVITCTKPSGKENEGIAALLKELPKVNRTYRVDVPLLMIIACEVPSRPDIYLEQLDDLRTQFGDKVSPIIPRAAIVDESYTNYTPLPYYGYRAKPTVQAYDAVIAHGREKLGLFGGTEGSADTPE